MNKRISREVHLKNALIDLCSITEHCFSYSVRNLAKSPFSDAKKFRNSEFSMVRSQTD